MSAEEKAESAEPERPEYPPGSQPALEPPEREFFETTENARSADARTENDGAMLIALERLRQVSLEGFTEEVDDAYGRGELAEAAVCYADLAINQQLTGMTPAEAKENAARLWPWDRDGFNPKDDPIRNLVRAGALIAAEIDRLKRLKRAQK